jgi:hypothetical protein
MKLKEKLYIDLNYYLCGDYDVKDKVAEQCEKIADDYAIEFAEWVSEHKEFNKSKSTKELLEIFKKDIEL